MKESIRLKNLFSLLHYYFNDILKGALERGLLKQKINRYSLFLICFISYFAYFISNMRTTGQLVKSANNISNGTEALKLLKITIMSYTDMYLILSVAFFIFLNSTISLTRSSSYVTNILPFSKKEILIAQKVYKLFIGIILFEGVQLLVFPFLGSIAILTVIEKFALLLLFHVEYIAVFFSLDTIYQIILSRMANTIIAIMTWLLDILLIIFAGFHFYIFRFKVEKIIGGTDCSVQIIIGTLLIFFILLFIINFLLILKCDYMTVTQSQQSYIFNKVPALRLNLITTFPVFYRHKNFIYNLSMISVLTIIMYSQGGIKLAMQTFAIYYFVIPLMSMYYADATSGIRKMYNLLRVSLYREMSSLLLSLAIILLPQIVVCYLFVGKYETVRLSVLVFVAALLMGLLFPKSRGNVNEAVSSILVFLIIILAYVVFKINDLIYPTVLLFLLVTSIVLRQERRG